MNSFAVGSATWAGGGAGRGRRPRWLLLRRFALHRRWVQPHNAAVTVDLDHSARRDGSQRVLNAHHRRHTQGSGDDGGVRGRTSMLDDQPDRSGTQQPDRFAGREFARDDDSPREIRFLAYRCLVRQRPHQTICHLAAVSGPFADAGAGSLLQLQREAFTAAPDSLLGGGSLADEPEDALAQSRVMQHQRLGVKDGCYILLVGAELGRQLGQLMIDDASGLLQT